MNGGWQVAVGVDWGLKRGRRQGSAIGATGRAVVRLGYRGHGRHGRCLVACLAGLFLDGAAVVLFRLPHPGCNLLLLDGQEANLLLEMVDLCPLLVLLGAGKSEHAGAAISNRPRPTHQAGLHIPPQQSRQVVQESLVNVQSCLQRRALDVPERQQNLAPRLPSASRGGPTSGHTAPENDAIQILQRRRAAPHSQANIVLQLTGQTAEPRIRELRVELPQERLDLEEGADDAADFPCGLRQLVHEAVKRVCQVTGDGGQGDGTEGCCAVDHSGRCKYIPNGLMWVCVCVSMCCTGCWVVIVVVTVVRAHNGQRDLIIYFFSPSGLRGNKPRSCGRYSYTEAG